MKKTLSVLIIAGFLAVDFLFFHDFAKEAGAITIPQYLTGFLSIGVFYICIRSLFEKKLSIN